MSANTLNLKPASGSLVRWPDGRNLAEAGDVVPNTGYWQRRLRDGDCEQVDDSTSKPIAPASAAETTIKAEEA